MKVAFATTDGIHINEHFGRAGRFVLYEFTRNSYLQLEDRLFSEGRDDAVEGTRNLGAVHEEAVENKVEKLADCRIVYMTKIGGPSAARLVQKGVMPIKSLEGEAIDSAVQELMETIRTAPAPWLQKALDK